MTDATTAIQAEPEIGPATIVIRRSWAIIGGIATLAVVATLSVLALTAGGGFPSALPAGFPAPPGMSGDGSLPTPPSGGQGLPNGQLYPAPGGGSGGSSSSP